MELRAFRSGCVLVVGRSVRDSKFETPSVGDRNRMEVNELERKSLFLQFFHLLTRAENEIINKFTPVLFPPCTKLKCTKCIRRKNNQIEFTVSVDELLRFLMETFPEEEKEEG